MRTGLAGHVCAWAAPMAKSASSTVSRRRRIFRIIFGCARFCRRFRRSERDYAPIMRSLRIDGARAMQANNMKLLAQHTLNGHGGMGEGMSLQLAKGSRRILWLAHESAPKNFTAVDITEPRHPKVVVQTDLPHARMRSNSL